MSIDAYLLGDEFAGRVKSFFGDLGLVPIAVKLAVLSDEDYNRLIDSDSNACLRIAESNQKNKTLTTRSKVEDYLSPESKYKIYIREVDTGIADLCAIMDAFLKIHYPDMSSEKAKSNFALAFKCYDKLFNEKALRDFLIELCKKDILFKI